MGFIGTERKKGLPDGAGAGKGVNRQQHLLRVPSSGREFGGLVFLNDPADARLTLAQRWMNLR